MPAQRCSPTKCRSTPAKQHDQTWRTRCRETTIGAQGLSRSPRRPLPRPPSQQRRRRARRTTPTTVQPGSSTCCCSPWTACTSRISPGTCASTRTRRWPSLVRGGVEYPNASTPIPSDSFPGMVAQVTGGDPAATGVYYDDTYNHALLPAGTTDCASAKPGTEVDFTEDLDKNKDSIDAGQGLSGLPNGILNMTGKPANADQPGQAAGRPEDLQAGLPAQLPQGEHGLRGRHDRRVCAPRGRTSTRPTTSSTARPAPASRTCSPRRSTARCPVAPPVATGPPTTPTPASTTTYKVEAVLNEIDGYDHSAHRQGRHAGDLRHELPDRLHRREAADLRRTDRRLPRRRRDARPAAVQFARTTSTRSSAAFVTELRRDDLDRSTTIILSAKHGQSPTEPAALTRIDDGPLLDGLNAAWNAAAPWRGRPGRAGASTTTRCCCGSPTAVRPPRRLRQELPAGAERHGQRHRRQAAKPFTARPV